MKESVREKLLCRLKICFVTMNLLLRVTLLVLLLGTVVALGGMAGGWSQGDVNNERVQEAAHFAVSSKYGKEATLKLVTSVEQQVVRGMNYRLEMEVAHTDAYFTKGCTKDEFLIWDDLGNFKVSGHKVAKDEC